MSKQIEVSDEIFIPEGFQLLCDLYKPTTPDYEMVRCAIRKELIHAVNLVKEGNSQGQLIQHVASCLVDVMKKTKTAPDQLLTTLAENHSRKITLVGGS